MLNKRKPEAYVPRGAMPPAGTDVGETRTRFAEGPGWVGGRTEPTPHPTRHLVLSRPPTAICNPQLPSIGSQSREYWRQSSEYWRQPPLPPSSSLPTRADHGVHSSSIPPSTLCSPRPAAAIPFALPFPSLPLAPRPAPLLPLPLRCRPCPPLD